LEPDRDLRPRYEVLDTLKYNVTSCPYCGYTAMNRNFEDLSSAQAKFVKESIKERTTGSNVKTINIAKNGAR